MFLLIRICDKIENSAKTKGSVAARSLSVVCVCARVHACVHTHVRYRVWVCAAVKLSHTSELPSLYVLAAIINHYVRTPICCREPSLVHRIWHTQPNRHTHAGKDTHVLLQIKTFHLPDF